VNLTYQDGRACFDGTIAATGWGAVYNFAFAGGGIPSDGDVWNATNVGVTGFELTTTGASLPPSFGLVFSVNNGAGFRDYCHGIGTGVVSVPFSDAVREDCANTPDTGNLSDLTQLEFLRLSFPITGSSYPVDFCLQLRAL